MALRTGNAIFTLLWIVLVILEDFSSKLAHGRLYAKVDISKIKVYLGT